MKSDDLDKLFKERLGNNTPSPSADLWNRLQNRIEEELPAKEEKKPIMMWIRSYAVAAATVVALSAGVVLYNLQQEAKAPSDTIAQVEQPNTSKETQVVADPDRWVKKSIASAEENQDNSETAIAEESIAKADVTTELPAIAASPVQKQIKPQEEKESTPVENNRAFVASTLTKKVQQDKVTEPVKIVMPETPASFASAKTDMNATPVEIIIKRTVVTQDAAFETVEEAPSDLEKKWALTKNIFKQVKNLSNGEQVNLSEIGLKTDRIALEAKIGKQRISKVINL